MVWLGNQCLNLFCVKKMLPGKNTHDNYMDFEILVLRRTG